MINGFEDITYDLTDYEMQLADDFVKAFSKRVGEDQAISAKQIQTVLKNKGYKKLSGARIRKVISYIRINGLVKNLIASSKGYWVETDLEKVRIYQESLLQRARKIAAIANTYE